MGSPLGRQSCKQGGRMGQSLQAASPPGSHMSTAPRASWGPDLCPRPLGGHACSCPLPAPHAACKHTCTHAHSHTQPFPEQTPILKKYHEFLTSVCLLQVICWKRNLPLSSQAPAPGPWGVQAQWPAMLRSCSTRPTTGAAVTVTAGPTAAMVRQGRGVRGLSAGSWRRPDSLVHPADDSRATCSRATGPGHTPARLAGLS